MCLPLVPNFVLFQMYPVVSNKEQSATSGDLECSTPQDQCSNQAGPILAHGMREFHAEKHDAIRQNASLSALGMYSLAAAACAIVVMAVMAQPKFQSLA